MSEEPLTEIAKRHGVELLLRFGSTAGGVTHAASDIDLAILPRCDVSPDLEWLGRLGADLEPYFPEGRLDIVLLEHPDPLLLKKILERCDLLTGEPRRLAELRMYAYRRYIDHRRFLAMEADYVTRRLSRTGS